MAASLEGRRLTEAHRLAQARLGADTANRILATFGLLDGTDLDGSFDRWLRVALPIIQARRSTSATLAANYLTTFRTLELGMAAPRVTPTLADAAPVDAVTTSLVVTGPAAIKSAIARGISLPAAIQTAQTTAARAGMRHALNGGRETITATTRADPRARGWARVTSAKACDFCSMLAGRGAVYGEATADFQAHDGCSCSAEPVYG